MPRVDVHKVLQQAWNDTLETYGWEEARGTSASWRCPFTSDGSKGYLFLKVIASREFNPQHGSWFKIVIGYGPSDMITEIASDTIRDDNCHAYLPAAQERKLVAACNEILDEIGLGRRRFMDADIFSYMSKAHVLTYAALLMSVDSRAPAKDRVPMLVRLVRGYAQKHDLTLVTPDRPASLAGGPGVRPFGSAV